MPMAVEFDPELVIISAGFDAAVGCPEGEQMVNIEYHVYINDECMIPTIVPGDTCLLCPLYPPDIRPRWWSRGRPAGGRVLLAFAG